MIVVLSERIDYLERERDKWLERLPSEIYKPFNAACSRCGVNFLLHFGHPFELKTA